MIETVSVFTIPRIATNIAPDVHGSRPARPPRRFRSTVPARFADSFSRVVLAELLHGVLVINAIRAASRKAFGQDNMYPLIYSLYGMPELSVAKGGRDA